METKIERRSLDGVDRSGVSLVSVDSITNRGVSRLVNTICIVNSSEQVFFAIRYHGSSSSIKCHMYHHVGGRRHTRGLQRK